MNKQENLNYGLFDYIVSILDTSLFSATDTTAFREPDDPAHQPLSVDMAKVQAAYDVKSFIDAMPGGFLIYHADEKEEIIYANKALLRIFGCETTNEFRELTGNSFKGIVHPEDLDEVEQSIMEQVTQSQYDLDYVEYRIRRKDGTIGWVEDYGHFIRGNAVGNIFYVFIADATEKKLRLTQEKEALLESSLKREQHLQERVDQYDKELKVIYQEHLRRLEIIEGLSNNYDSIL